MKRLIHFFLDNARLNYTILIFLIFMGISSYIKIPKEVFPIVAENQIVVRGSYVGANAASLNSFAVTEIENELESVVGIKEIESTIRSGSFSIVLYLEDSYEPNDLINDVKDAISVVRSSLPSDMDEPTASVVKRTMSLLTIALTGDYEKELLDISKDLKTEIFKFNHINEIQISGDSDLQIDIYLDEEKLNAYGINSKSLISQIQNLSYIYPVASIEQKGNYVYVNTTDKKLVDNFWENSLIEVDSKKLYLSDLATIKIHYPKEDTIARVNGKSSITLNIYKDEQANVIELSKEVQKYLQEFKKNHKNINIEVIHDDAKPIKERLNTVISNISFGLVLVGLSMFVLISPRISVVVVLGIPFSFIIGVITFYYAGYSLSMLSLLAVLIMIGIIVDDAIVVSENIQRYLDEGKSIKDAVYKGTIEMLPPVLVASLTTVFAFLPMLYLSGRLGSFISIIPIVVSILIVASLIESFLFLPIHAKHMLKPKEKMLNWAPVYKFYEKILHLLIHNKFIFIGTFVIVVPLATFFMATSMRFQFFPNMDSDRITLSVKFDESKSLEDSSQIAKSFEKLLLDNKKELNLKTLQNRVGLFSSLSGDSESIENAFTMSLMLEDFKENNWIQNYLQPIFTFSFDFEQKEKTRIKKSFEIQKEVQTLIEPLLKKFDVTDKTLTTTRIGIVRTDLEFKISSKDSNLIQESILKLKEELAKIDGVVDISDNAELGKYEYKYKINNYGESLGLTESYIANALNSYFMERDQTKAVSIDGLVDVKTQLLTKDNLDSFKNFQLPLEDGRFVELSKVIDFTITKDFETLEKENSKIIKTVYANVELEKITSSEALVKIKPALTELEKSGVEIILGGEFEQNEQLKDELSIAVMISIFLIFIVLLINFPSFRISFIIISVIPFSLIGALLGHLVMGLNIMMPSLIGMLGLAGVVINDGIIMLDFIKNTKTKEEFYSRAKLRIRPILITSITTLLGLSTLIFYPSGQGVVLQPLAISLGFGLLWGTILNLIYLPALYAVLFKLKD
ncbi:multidrug transporter AcrB [Halarcobacter ebronensis]|uniref:Multidrug transporter AcrB n=1 Tax=Halarcobacter ebronensis TaxID=1462615 RepID=A0A4Q0YJX3_9BACT|nr:efflux RND transporter permease subunit [Halarcobacter ebronensis]RXJ70204.1 multidrug transporter AcrB [Halarcobacter ebronensis]